MAQKGIQAIDQMGGFPDDLTIHSAILESVLYQAVRKNPKRAFEESMTLEGNARERALSAVFKAWGDFDPLAALKSIASVEELSLRLNLIQVVSSGWFIQDAELAYENSKQLPEELQPVVEQQAMQAIARDAPDKAAQFLSEITDENRKRKFALNIPQVWTKVDEIAALDWKP